MPLLDHLAELRKRLMVIALIVAAGTVAGYYLFHPVFTFLTEPLCDLPLSVRRTLGTETCFVFHDITGAFAFRLKLAVIIGVVLTAPLWLYNLWAFLAPALHSRERRWAYGFVAVGTPLFLLGATLAFTILRRAFEFLLGFTPDTASNLIDANTYVTWVAMLILIFGISFEAPLIIILLNLAGVLRGSTLTKSRRMVAVGLAVYCAIVTPGQDASTMVALLVPMYVLYELSAAFCRMHDRRQERRENQSPNDLEPVA
ncbi:twin-arginine translocase subunit TatC [Actinoplanes bogorensis]|uniref:Sec-independent protein translocase protein TatC n=1 Tax=Paractinoplanes bogorensis TaxID=1610840 RepID=A0ABS5YYT8_9ACTN|nr:twin-arginine translocase subunit TatC [Actinoplanes bogorensis]MBU2667275.1 twin-arginine translocase subunit TatC [Actinoplanes bogorensis]